jgi:GNAT superfamily N-acetyltransferase
MRPARSGCRSLALGAVTDVVKDGIVFMWRGPLGDEEMVDLVVSHGGNSERGWWDRVRLHSLGWVTARTDDGMLVGFVNVAWDGSDHAFLIDTKTRGSYQRRKVGVRLVEVAVQEAKAAGCEWLHVDFEPELRAFYFDACGFVPTDAGLIHLSGVRV